MRKVSRSTDQREAFHEFLADLQGVESGPEVLSELACRAATMAVQEALEAEQPDFIGRGRYKPVPRAEGTEAGTAGARWTRPRGGSK